MVVADVENQQRFILVGVREVLPDIFEITPKSVLGRFRPPHQLIRRFRVAGGVLLDRRHADYGHTLHVRIPRAGSQFLTLAMPRFQTVVRRARFVYSPYIAYEMK